VLEDHEATAAGSDGLLEVRASKSGSDVVVHGTLSAELTVPCARCLKPVPLVIEETLSLLYVPGKVSPAPAAKPLSKEGHAARSKKKKGDPEEYEISAEDADTLPYDGENVFLDDVIRDELILDTPIFPLCSDDCPGMSPPLPGDESNASARQGARTAPGPDDVPPDADIDPRLLPLLRLKAKRD
jgi:uncharacterized protein